MEERTSAANFANESKVGHASLDTGTYLDQALEVSIEAWLQDLGSREPGIAANIRRLLAVQSLAGFTSFLNEPVTPTRAAHALTGELIGNFLCTTTGGSPCGV